MPNTLNISEIFYSIQGEGVWTGTPMVFVRLAGCSMGCDFCDTKYSWNNGQEMIVEKILGEIKEFKSNRVCITGGEPLEQDVSTLIFILNEAGYKTHLETNGAWKIPGGFDWITVSPKKDVLFENLFRADEIKCVITCEKDLFKYLYYRTMSLKNLFFVPVDNNVLIANMIVDFIKENGGGIKLGWQLQKTIVVK